MPENVNKPKWLTDRRLAIVSVAASVAIVVVTIVTSLIGSAAKDARIRKEVDLQAKKIDKIDQKVENIRTDLREFRNVLTKRLSRLEAMLKYKLESEGP